MKLKLSSINGQGDKDKEYVSLEVLEDCDLKYYIVADSTYTGENTISNTFRHVFWFYPKTVKKGDFVWLYTKNGKDSSRGNRANTTTHIFYWGSDQAIWNDTGDAGILFEVSTWSAKRAK